MRSFITAVSLAVAFFIAQPTQAQYSGNDDTIKVQEPLVSVNSNLTSIDKHPLHPFKKEAMTFYWDRNSNVLVNIIGKALKDNLEPTFGTMGKSIVSKKPQSLGYQ